jgi:hypothetical protein
MGKFKQFLFGVLAGAGAAFVALQYHVVQTHQGFRVVPRTPQHSIGLAFADIRNWDAAKWADRPELARALVANGSTDLVAGSVAEGLMESVSSGSQIDQLRGFLNQPSSDTQQGDPLFSTPGFLPIRKDSGEAPASDLDDLFSTPFPLDARKQSPVEAASRDNPPQRTTLAQRPNLDVEEIFSSGVSGLDVTQKPAAAGPSSISSPADSRSAAQEADLIEHMLFGEEKVGSPSSETGSPTDFGMFEDITSTLEGRAAEAMQRATAGVRNEAGQAIQDSGTSLDRFVRDQVKSSLPESVSRMFDEDPIPVPDQVRKVTVPDAIKALQNGFDPFLE